MVFTPPPRFPRFRWTETFFTIKEGDFSKITPSLFTLKEGSTSHLGLLPSGKKRETALRCSEPLRFMVGGPSKVFAIFCGLGPPGVNLLMGPPEVNLLMGWPGDNLLIFQQKKSVS